MATVNYPPAESLMPHRGRMCFIDQVIAWDQESLMVSGHTRRNHPFAKAQGIPTSVGLEYLAQAAAVMGGLEARERQESPPSGLLIACPGFTAHIAWLPFDVNLHVQIHRIGHQGNHHRFEGQVLPSRDADPWLEATFDIMLQPQEPLQDKG